MSALYSVEPIRCCRSFLFVMCVIVRREAEKEPALRIIKDRMVHPGQCVSLETPQRKTHCFPLSRVTRQAPFLTINLICSAIRYWAFLDHGCRGHPICHLSARHVKTETSGIHTGWFTLGWGDTLNLCFLKH